MFTRPCLRTRTHDAAVNVEEQQITLQLIAEARIATTPSTIAQTASNELVVTAPEGCTHHKHIIVRIINQATNKELRLK